MFIVNLQNFVSKIDISGSLVLVEIFTPGCYNWEAETIGRKHWRRFVSKNDTNRKNRLTSSCIILPLSLNRITPLGYLIDRRQCPGVLWIRESCAFCQIR